MEQIDRDFLSRAIRLAMNGRGQTEPNPSVGCVIVKNGRVIGEGRTQFFGGPHAEPTALAACTESPEGATAYVTLEPCCHTNKKTPPCAPRLIAAKIARVFYGCLDPNPPVNGNGVAMLRGAGIKVIDPDAEMNAAAKQLIAPFIKRINFRRPYVTLKWAATADGKVAGPNGKRIQISNEISMRAIHQLRARCDAIMVTSRTVANDDPNLTARNVDNARPLLRCVLDRDLKISPSAKIVQTADVAKTIIYCDESSIAKDPEKAADLQSRDVILSTAADYFSDLYERGVTHLLIEPGPTLARTLFTNAAKMIDRVWIFQSDKSLGDPAGLPAPNLPANYQSTGTINLRGDVLTEYLNPQSDVFFAAAPSADFVLSKIDNG